MVELLLALVGNGQMAVLAASLCLVSTWTHTATTTTANTARKTTPGSGRRRR
jgi:hypothetical protein